MADQISKSKSNSSKASPQPSDKVKTGVRFKKVKKISKSIKQIESEMSQIQSSMARIGKDLTAVLHLVETKK